jgi:hypothetical protein
MGMAAVVDVAQAKRLGWQNEDAELANGAEYLAKTADWMIKVVDGG